MLHICVERFDVTDTVGKILGTKRGLNALARSTHPAYPSCLQSIYIIPNSVYTVQQGPTSILSSK